MIRISKDADHGKETRMENDVNVEVECRDGALWMFPGMGIRRRNLPVFVIFENGDEVFACGDGVCKLKARVSYFKLRQVAVGWCTYLEEEEGLEPVRNL